MCINAVYTSTNVSSQITQVSVRCTSAKMAFRCAILCILSLLKYLGVYVCTEPVSACTNCNTAVRVEGWWWTLEVGVWEGGGGRGR